MEWVEPWREDSAMMVSYSEDSVRVWHDVYKAVHKAVMKVGGYLQQQLILSRRLPYVHRS